MPEKAREEAMEIYKRADKGKEEALLKIKRVFEGLDERDRTTLMIAANIGIIAPPARLVTRLEAYRRITDELHKLVAQEGVSPIDDVLEAERILLEQTWWNDFVEEWKENWRIYNEGDIGSLGYRHKKLQPYVYDFGYYYQTPADYKDKGPLKGPIKEVSWRVDIKSNSVASIRPPISNQLEKGLVLASRGRNEEAIIEFNRYIEVRPNDPIAYEVRGDSYYDTGRFDKAIDDYSTSIKLEPKLAEAYDKRAITYAELGDYEKSIKDLSKAIELYPENAEYYFNRSIIHDKSGNIDKTIDDCTKAIELDKNYAKAFYNRGMAYSEKGEHDKAISDYNAAIQLQPDFTADVYFNRGVAYQAKGEYKKALEDFRRIRDNLSDREDIGVVERKIMELNVNKMSPAQSQESERLQAGKEVVMKCFYHPDKDAVAECAKCGKPICRQCVWERMLDKVICWNCALNRTKKKSDWLKSALTIYTTRATEFAENKFLLSTWLSWVVGGYAIFKSGKWSEMPDSLYKAKLLLELGTQAMVSTWYWSWYRQKSHAYEEKEDAVKAGLMNIQTFLDMRSEENIELYLGFDKEFQCIMKDENNRMPLYYTDMFHQRYWECITGERIVDWTKVQFPLESQERFINVCHEGKRHGFANPLVDDVEVWVIITSAGKLMFDEFKRIYKGEQ